MYKVLIVDDESLILQGLHTLIEKGGLIDDIRTAMDGKEGLYILENGGLVDILITDIRMPGIGGIDLVKTIRNVLAKINRERRQRVKAEMDENLIRENIINRWLYDYIGESELLERAVC